VIRGRNPDRRTGLRDIVGCSVSTEGWIGTHKAPYEMEDLLLAADPQPAQGPEDRHATSPKPQVLVQLVEGGIGLLPHQVLECLGVDRIDGPVACHRRVARGPTSPSGVAVGAIGPAVSRGSRSSRASGDLPDEPLRPEAFNSFHPSGLGGLCNGRPDLVVSCKLVVWCNLVVWCVGSVEVQVSREGRGGGSTD